MKHLTVVEIFEISRIIDNWPLPTIAWEAICREVEQHLGRRYTRQTLMNKLEIRDAFIRAKNKRANPNIIKSKTNVDRRIADLEAQVSELKRIQAVYDLRFLRHLEVLAGCKDAVTGAPLVPKDLDAPLHYEVPLLNPPAKRRR